MVPGVNVCGLFTLVGKLGAFETHMLSSPPPKVEVARTPMFTVLVLQ
jgi:hypothetical protein